MFKKIFSSLKKIFISYFPVIISLILWSLITVFLINFVNQLFNSSQEDLIEREKILLLFLLILSLILFIAIIIYLVNIVLSIIRKEFGAKMKLKIAIFFIFVALLPVIPFFQIGTRFIESSMNMWFSKNIGSALDMTSELLTKYYNEQKSVLVKKAFSIQEIAVKHQKNTVQDILQIIRLESSGVNNFTVWDKNGKTVLSEGDPLFNIDKPGKMKWDEVALIHIEESGIFSIKVSHLGDYMILPVRLSSHRGETLGFVNLAIKLLPEFKSTASEVDTALRNYNIAGLYKNFFRRGFTILFTAVMFPIILIILIISLFFNREILDPIENLSRATRRIAEGDLKFQVESSYSDEFNLLSRSFNSMINELEMSRDKLQFKQKILTWKEIGEQFAHELKNPLTPIRLQTDRILRKIENKAENLEEVILNGLKIIRIESEKMESILNEFTGLSQYQSFNRMSLDLNDMMSEVVETMTRSYDRLSISFIPFKQHILMISVDPQQFKKVLMNLFENSCERMKRTGSIRFEISEKVTDLRKYAVITMSDQCTEGSDVRNENDFSPYLHQEGHSKLLYLIIQKIVNEHDGRFYYEMSHSGTDYRIELPVAEMEAK